MSVHGEGDIWYANGEAYTSVKAASDWCWCLQVCEWCRPQQEAPELQGHQRCCGGTLEALASSGRWGSPSTCSRCPRRLPPCAQVKPCLSAVVGGWKLPLIQLCQHSLQVSHSRTWVSLMPKDVSLCVTVSCGRVLQGVQGSCTSYQTQSLSCRCCGACRLPQAATRQSSCHQRCRPAPQLQQPPERNCQRSGQQGCCSGVQ
jgi:hypothetical protein